VLNDVASYVSDPTFSSATAAAASAAAAARSSSLVQRRKLNLNAKSESGSSFYFSSVQFQALSTSV